MSNEADVTMTPEDYEQSVLEREQLVAAAEAGDAEARAQLDAELEQEAAAAGAAAADYPPPDDPTPDGDENPPLKREPDEPPDDDVPANPFRVPPHEPAPRRGMYVLVAGEHEPVQVRMVHSHGTVSTTDGRRFKRADYELVGQPAEGAELN